MMLLMFGDDFVVIANVDDEDVVVLKQSALIAS